MLEFSYKIFCAALIAAHGSLNYMIIPSISQELLKKEEDDQYLVTFLKKFHGDVHSR